MKKLLILLMLAVLLLSSCNIKKPEYIKYSYHFFDCFDTIITINAYAKTKADFNKISLEAHNLFRYYHKLFDIYNEYDDIVNLCTVNKQAGSKKLIISKDLFNFLQYSIDLQKQFGNDVNIAFGPVLSLWHKYRQEALNNPSNAKTPSYDELFSLNQHCGINNIVLNRTDLSISFKDKLSSIDVGAIAKGYACQKVADFMHNGPLKSFVINAGGNISCGDKPQENKDFWNIGIVDPKKAELGGENLLDTVQLNNKSVVSSGDYQRYYYVGNTKYSHIIDSLTLYPASNNRGVSVIAQNSALADFLSTLLFILSYDKGKDIVDKLDGVAAIWILSDYTVKYNKAYTELSKTKGKFK